MNQPLSAKERGALGAQKRWAKGQQSDQVEHEGETPKYRITAICYGEDDKLYDPASTPRDDNGDNKPLYMETWNEYPAWYMEPANDAARAMYTKHPPAPQGNAMNELSRLTSDQPKAA